MSKNNLEKISVLSKYKAILIIILTLFLLLLCRIAYLQSIKAPFLKDMAYEQLISDKVISTKRGLILDSSRNTSCT